MSRSLSLLVGLFILTLVHATTAHATWSIVVADEETGEVALGTVTCLEGLDLLAFTPAIVVGKGAACAQASGDFDGVRRQIIFDGLSGDVPLAEIMFLLEHQVFHDRVQYGIVSAYDGALTYAGPETEPWSGGVTGAEGSLRYAIQGNVLVGPCVLPSIEAALVETDGDLPAKLMAAMAAARAAGGDGRCSCSLSDPDNCNCPPPFFLKSGHVGGMIVARIGDVDDPGCDLQGCADGDYFMRLDASGLFFSDPDPVVHLQEQFEAWRSGLEGRPDAVFSTAASDPPVIPPNGISTATLTIALNDWRGMPIEAPIQSVTVEHADGSAGRSAIGEVTPLDASTFIVTLTSASATGEDRFAVTVDDGIRPVRLMPDPRFVYTKLGDVNGDGVVAFMDLNILAFNWGPCDPPPQSCVNDLNGDGQVSITDMLILLANWG